MLAPIDSPVMADFVANLDRINSLADECPGFIWRLKGEENNALALKVFDDPCLLVNMSVWSSKDTLFAFTYQTAHKEILKRKKEWFSKIKTMHMACWYLPADQLPTVEEAKERLAYLNAQGETPYAFTFKSKFLASDAANYHPLPI